MKTFFESLVARLLRPRPSSSSSSSNSWHFFEDEDAGRTRIFRRLTSRKQAPLINTPLQRGDLRQNEGRNRFNGFVLLWKTVETASRSTPVPFTPLKRCVNESTPRAGQIDYEKSRLTTVH